MAVMMKTMTKSFVIAIELRILRCSLRRVCVVDKATGNQVGQNAGNCGEGQRPAALCVSYNVNVATKGKYGGEERERESIMSSG